MITVLVTHDVDEAIALADRIFVLSARPAHVIGEIRVENRRSAMSGEESRSIAARIEACAANRADCSSVVSGVVDAVVDRVAAPQGTTTRRAAGRRLGSMPISAGPGALDGLEHLEGCGVLGGVMDAENRGAARQRHEVGGERRSAGVDA